MKDQMIRYEVKTRIRKRRKILEIRRKREVIVKKRREPRLKNSVN